MYKVLSCMWFYFFVTIWFSLSKKCRVFRYAIKGNFVSEVVYHNRFKKHKFFTFSYLSLPLSRFLEEPIVFMWRYCHVIVWALLGKLNSRYVLEWYQRDNKWALANMLANKRKKCLNYFICLSEKKKQIFNIIHTEKK